ncbi:hypothetical protein LIER_13084 [Lithospermum erythrorhizon]|uniref:Uncharacterized protein n=1 Tax=Lithospermum erythrorhizon TaxID=34254 RepID=A0AAV3PYB3_LITER
MGPVAPQINPPAATVELTSFATFSDPSMGHYGDQNMGNLPLHVELNQPFPPQNPLLTPIPSRESDNPEEEFLQRVGKVIMLPGYSGKYLSTPYRIPNLQVVNGSHVLANHSDYLARVNHSLDYQIKCMKKSLSHKSGLIEGLSNEQTVLKKELETWSQLFVERTKTVVDLHKKPSTEKEAAKAWATERPTLLAETDDSRGRYLELEQTRAADISRANQAVEQATKERDVALASVASARVQSRVGR